MVRFAASDPANPNKAEEHPAIDVNGTRFDTPVQWTILAQYTDDALAAGDWNVDKLATANLPLLPTLKLRITQGGGGAHVHREADIPQWGLAVPLVASSFRVAVTKVRPTLEPQSVRVIAVPAMSVMATVRGVGPNIIVPAFAQEFARSRANGMTENLQQFDRFGNSISVARFNKVFLHPMTHSITLTNQSLAIAFEVIA